MKLEILTYELYNGVYIPILTHTFYGKTDNELNQLVAAHKETDSFFKASFTGEFQWKGGIIKLQNHITKN